MLIEKAKRDYFFSAMNLSGRTQEWYQQKLEVFCDWCAAQGLKQIEEITRGMVARFLAHLRDEGQYKEITLKGYAQVIRRFLNYCAEEDWMPRRKVDMPKPDERIIDTFTPRQVRAMLQACGKNLRDIAIVSLLLDTGIRASELCTLRAEDVYLGKEAGYIQVRGKGRKERQISFGEHTRLALFRYMRVRPDQTTFFASLKQPSLTVSGLDQIIYRLKKKVGASRFPGIRVSAHTFRHTFAVNFLLAGGDLFVLSRLMGHSDVKVTQVYLKAVSQEQAKSRYVSPLARLMEGE